MSNKRRTFVDLFLSGEAGPDDIEEFEEAWHTGDSTLSLAAFLGLSDDEYSLFVEQPTSLRYIIASKKTGRPLADVLKHACDMKLAARDGSPEEAARVAEWLRKRGRLTAW